MIIENATTTENFSITDSTPPTGSPSTPTDTGTYSATTTIAFFWSNGTAVDHESGIGGYWLEVKEAGNGSETTKFSGITGDVTICKITDCEHGKTYYARVLAINTNGTGTSLYGQYSNWSDGIMIDTTSPLYAPATPTDRGQYGGPLLTFNWTQGTASDPESGIAGYWLQVWAGTASAPAGSSSYKFNKDVGNITSCNVSDCSDGIMYFARVKAKNGAGLWGDWSGISDGITVDTTPLTPPSDIKLPAGLTSIVSGGEITLNATTTPGAKLVGITLKDTQGRILQTADGGIDTNGVISGTITLGEFTKNYPLCTGAQAVDLGLLIRPVDDRLCLGVTAKNIISSPIKYKNLEHPLPVAFRIGCALKQNDRLTVCADYEKSDMGSNADSKTRFKLGCELLIMKLLAVRAGYKIGYDQSTVNLGLGMNTMGYLFDYSFAGMKDLDNIHQVSFAAKFGGGLTNYHKAEGYHKKEMYERAVYWANKVKDGEENFEQAKEIVANSQKQIIARAKPKAEESSQIASQELGKKKEEVATAQPVEKPKVAGKRMNIAVSDLEAHEVSAMEASTIADFLRTELINSQVFVVLERSNMSKILAEQKFQQTGCTTNECAVQMGKILNVEKILIGSFSKILNAYHITVRLVDVETGAAVLAETVSFTTTEELPVKITELVNKIAKRMAEQ